MATVQLPSPARCLLWRVDLDSPPSAEAAACLSDDEWQRAHRFVFARDRQRYVAAHAALRAVLASHTGMPGAFLDFRLGAFGKPALVEPAGLRFNLSHSQSVGLIALCEDAEIGVDVEVLRSMPDAEALAQANFSPDERRALQALPAEARDRAFLVGWTRKEACLKAMGMGLSVDTRSFDVGIAADAREVRIAGDDVSVRLALSSFDGGAGTVCAVARVQDCEPVALAQRPRLQESELYA